MKQRILSILMTLCLCLTLLPTVALADTAPSGTPLTQANISNYMTLTGGSSETDMVYYYLSENVTVSESISVEGYVTLDLNGKTLTGANGSNGSVGNPGDKGGTAITVTSGGELTITDTGTTGSIVGGNGGIGGYCSNGGGGGAAITVTGGSLTVSSGRIVGGNGSNGSDGGGGGSGGSGIEITGGTVNIKGGNITGGKGNDGSDGSNSGGTGGAGGNGLLIKGGTVSVGGNGTISGGTPGSGGNGTDGLDGAPGGVGGAGGNGLLIESGSVSIDGGKFHGVNGGSGGSGSSEGVSGGNGGNGGSGLRIEGGSVTVSGGEFHGANGSGGAVGNALSATGGSVTISGGCFNGKIKIDDDTNKNISGGYFTFTADPTTYVDNENYVNPSDKVGYTYVVNQDQPDPNAVRIFSAETTIARLSGSSSFEEAEQAALEAVIGRASVTGVGLALSTEEIKVTAVKSSILGVDTGTGIIEGGNVYVGIKTIVEATDYDSTDGTLAFTVTPSFNLSVNGASIMTGHGTTGTDDWGQYALKNDHLNGNAITVKLPLPEGYAPMQIKYTDGEGNEQYLINKQLGTMRGAGSFRIVDGCAVFTITQFSTFELSTEVTYVEPPAPVSPRPSYDVTVEDTENGTVTLDRETVPQGGKVTITAEGDDGYRVGSVTALDKNGNPVPVTKEGYGVYSAVVPSGGLTVAVEFEPEMPFADVPVEKYFYCAVRWANEAGIVGGTSATTFSPYASCTRGQLVTFLWRAAGEPAAKTTANPFADVSEGSAFYQAILWASENNIVGGYDDGTFRPSAAITRQQAAAILYRYAEFAGMDVSASDDLADFKDAGSVSAYALPAMKWAVGDGILWGSNGYLLPASACTRAQIVSFLYRFLG